MKLYNTLSRTVEDIHPQHPVMIMVYTCGPTVYDYPHIGNWFTFIRYDILIRALRDGGFQPKWVMNITDVGHLVSDADEGEDKLEKGARREGKSAWDIAAYYSDYFMHALDRLGMLHPDELPKATDHIQQQIDLIKTLEEKGFTYTISDGVYFDTSKLDDYGKLARLDIEHLKAGARVETNPEKRHITDFALWKFSSKGEKRDMEWDSPWGKGFPGWHLECSAMAMQYLGETIDLHGGGIDHIPVHHTNEIAQSEAATGKPFSKYWFHANFILVDGKKMSKSLGNFYTLEDIEAKGFDLQAFRLLVLESHYRTEANFSWETLEAASNRLGRWRAVSDMRWQVQSPPQFLDELPGDEAALSELQNNHPHTKESRQLLEQARQALQDDLDTPAALRAIDGFMDMVEQSGMTSFMLPDFTKLLQFISRSLGIDLFADDISEAQKQLLTKRQAARNDKNWELSDQLRDQLEEQGIGVRDTSHGQIWFRL